MTPPAIPGAPREQARFHARKCVRHSAREAAARCPACAEFFCRECVVEHEGKLLCGPCLAKRASKTGTRHERGRRVRRVARAGAGVLALWFVFYGIGALLLKIPPELHDGTVWKKMAESAPR